MNYNDDKSWKLFKDGLTKGIFQLESQLGRSWSKKLEPRSIEELSALISIIRPGVLNAMLDGTSLAMHFVDRKHKREDVTYIHEALEKILSDTQGILIYQEQAMIISTELAGFSLQEADDLRKAIGKKKSDLMKKIRLKFIAGCEKVGLVDKDSADEIFSWIEKSARYLFNKSHGISYAINAYQSAWYKANHTLEFFLASFFYASEKQDPHEEIYELVSEARVFDINIKLPDLTNFDSKFNIRNGDIYFGVKDIKSLTGVTGDKVITAIRDVEEKLQKPAKDFSWMDVLVHLSNKINKTAFKSLCSIGFFSTKKTGVSRSKALHEYSSFRELTKGEVKWVEKNYPKKQWTNLAASFKSLAPRKRTGGGTHNYNRQQAIESEIQVLNDPPYDLSDDPIWIVEQETRFLGCPISLSKIEAADVSSSNTSCKNIIDGKKGKGIIVAANISRINDYKIKKEGKNKGKMMSFLTIEDGTASLDNVIVFPEMREKYHFILFEDNNLLFYGNVEKDNTFIVDKIHEI